MAMKDGDTTVGAFDAKTHLSALLERVRQGERITITRHGVPVALLVPPGDELRREVAAAVVELAGIRDRTRPGPESIRDLRDEGRRR